MNHHSSYYFKAYIQQYIETYCLLKTCKYMGFVSDVVADENLINKGVYTIWTR